MLTSLYGMTSIVGNASKQTFRSMSCCLLMAVLVSFPLVQNLSTPVVPGYQHVSYHYCKTR
jgi:hypothetical protein